MKKILVLVSGYLPGFKNGGPARTVSNLIEALGDGFSFNVICLDRDLGDEIPYSSVVKKEWNKQGKALVFYVEPGLRGIIKLAAILRTNQFDILYLNSFFSFQFSISPLILVYFFHRTRLVILGPRGEFSLGALGLKSLKKNIYIFLFRIFGLHKKVIWHASTSYEAADINRMMGSNVAIRTAVDLSIPSKDIQLMGRSDCNILHVVLVSRVSRMKNILGALNILKEVRKQVRFDLYGPLEDETYWKECLDAAARLPANITFTYGGSLQPSEVALTLARYDLFLLPTFGENYGHAIAEALSVGLPVLVSDATPWRDLHRHNIGWDISLGHPLQFAARIEECCDKSSQEYLQWRNHIHSWSIENVGNQSSVDENKRLFSDLD